MSLTHQAPDQKLSRLSWAGACLLLGSAVLPSCRSASNPDNAPAYGTIGGITAGALIGSASGSTGTGALLGGMLGNSGGQIARNEGGRARAFDDSMLLRDVSGSVKAATKFDTALAKEHNALARDRATGGGLQNEMAVSQAKRRLPEIRGWINTMEKTDQALGRAISYETSSPAGRLNTLLNQRNQVRSRLASLKMHESWFKSLAS